MKTGSETIPSSSHPVNGKDLAGLKGGRITNWKHLCVFSVMFFPSINPFLHEEGQTVGKRTSSCDWVGWKVDWSWEGSQTGGGKSSFESLQYPREQVVRLWWRPCESYYKILNILQDEGNFLRL